MFVLGGWCWGGSQRIAYGADTTKKQEGPEASKAAKTPEASKAPEALKSPKAPETGAKKPKPALRDEVTGWSVMVDFAASYNGPGVRLIGRGGYQWRLYAHENVAFSDNFFRLSAIGQATPANLDIGPNFSIQPASFVRFGGNYTARIYFPTFSVGTLFASPEQLQSHFAGRTDFLDGEKRLDQQRDATTQRNGHQLLMSTHILRIHWLLQFRIVGIVAQWLGVMSWFFHNYDDVAKAEYVYEPLNDIVMKKEDLLFTSVALAGYEWRNFRFLAVSTYALAFQSREELLSLGPAVQWTITPQWGVLKNPFLLLVSRWWIKHRFRTGPMPNIALVFQSEFAL